MHLLNTVPGWKGEPPLRLVISKDSTGHSRVIIATREDEQAFHEYVPAQLEYQVASYSLDHGSIAAEKQKSAGITLSTVLSAQIPELSDAQQDRDIIRTLAEAKL